MFSETDILYTVIAVLAIYVGIDLGRRLWAFYRRADAFTDRIKTALSMAAGNADWIELDMLAEAGHQAAGGAVVKALQALEDAVKQGKDKPSLIRALTPCCVKMVSLTDEYPDLLEKVAKVAVKEGPLMGRVAELQAEREAAKAKAERQAEEKKKFEEYLAKRNPAMEES